MCIWMEVSRSGFYEWRDKPESATAKRRGILALYVRKSFEDSGDTYGYRRVHTDLMAWGVPAGPELVRSLMRDVLLFPYRWCGVPAAPVRLYVVLNRVLPGLGGPGSRQRATEFGARARRGCPWF